MKISAVISVLRLRKGFKSKIIKSTAGWLCCVILGRVQTSLEWREVDRKLLAMTNDVDYDVEGKQTATVVTHRRLAVC